MPDKWSLANAVQRFRSGFGADLGTRPGQPTTTNQIVVGRTVPRYPGPVMLVPFRLRLSLVAHGLLPDSSFNLPEGREGAPRSHKKVTKFPKHLSKRR